MSPETAHRITLVSVTGLADAQGAARALAFSQRQLPACRALLCSPVRPADLPPGIEHLPIAPLNYHEYSWFMLFALWRVVPTEFALVVQEDGWVVPIQHGFATAHAIARLDRGSFRPQAARWKRERYPRFRHLAEQVWADMRDAPEHLPFTNWYAAITTASAHRPARRPLATPVQVTA